MTDYDYLIAEWCESLARLQITGTGNPQLDGALLCPACGRIHGRCVDAMLPFLLMAQRKGDGAWTERAKALFEWAEATVSQPNGSVLNDIDSKWDGITVFYVAQLADCLRFFGDLLDEGTRQRWTDRIARAAEFLLDYDKLNQNNVNYSIGWAYALERAGSLLGIELYRKRGEALMDLGLTCLDEKGMLFGEGVPRHERSPRGCLPVDIGYNVEESLPLMALYAHERGDDALMDRVRAAYAWHLKFLLPDGGWDNSFGTRKFKWSYWGSRTTDGACVGLVLAAQGACDWQRTAFLEAARANMRQISNCQVDGLLAGGPHSADAGQSPCIHHSFDHAKALAILAGMGMLGELGDGGDAQGSATVHAAGEPTSELYPDLGIAVVNAGDLRATICATDWEYKRDICTSGGLISLLHHRGLGPVLAAGMGSYRRIELANMQVSQRVRHESLVPRIEVLRDGSVWSSVFDVRASVSSGEGECPVVSASGVLRDADHSELSKSEYSVTYAFDTEGTYLEVSANLQQGVMVLPLISRSREPVETEEGKVIITRLGVADTRLGAMTLEILEGSLRLPYGKERIFNLTPGFQALKVEIASGNEKVKFRLSFSE